MCSPEGHITIAKGILTLARHMMAPSKSLSDVIQGEVCALVGYMMDNLRNSSMHSLRSLSLQVKAQGWIRGVRLQPFNFMPSTKSSFHLRLWGLQSTITMRDLPRGCL
jgi:hypothetical protein